MSADNYISIVQGKDGKFRGYMAFASDDMSDVSGGTVEFEADDLENAVRKAQGIRTEYGFEVVFRDGHRGEEVMTGETTGMTLRDYFAAQASRGLCADLSSAKSVHSGEDDSISMAKVVAELSFALADAMLAEREKSK